MTRPNPNLTPINPKLLRHIGTTPPPLINLLKLTHNGRPLKWRLKAHIILNNLILSIFLLFRQLLVEELDFLLDLVCCLVVGGGWVGLVLDS